MQPINESIVFAAIRQCLATADHYIRQGNRRDAEFYLDTADAYANRLIFGRSVACLCSVSARRKKLHPMAQWLGSLQQLGPKPRESFKSR
jgi:hypothetical protein